MGAVTCAPPWMPAAHLNGIPRNVCSGRIRGVDTHNTGSAPSRNWHLVPGQDPKRLRGTHRVPWKHLSIPVTWWVTDSAASQLFHVTKAIFKNRSLGRTTGLIILFNMKTKVKKKNQSLWKSWKIFPHSDFYLPPPTKIWLSISKLSAFSFLFLNSHRIAFVPWKVSLYTGVSLLSGHQWLLNQFTHEKLLMASDPKLLAKGWAKTQALLSRRLTLTSTLHSGLPM